MDNLSQNSALIIVLVIGSGASQLSPLHFALVFGFGALCFYIGRANSLQDQLDEHSHGLLIGN